MAASVLVGAVLLLASCGTPAPKQSDLTAALVDSGIPKPIATCTSKALVSSLTDAQLSELAERGAGGAPVDDTTRTDDSADKLAKAMSACRDELVATSPTSTTTSPPDSPGNTLPTTLPPITDGAELNPTTTAP